MEPSSGAVYTGFETPPPIGTVDRGLASEPAGRSATRYPNSTSLVDVDGRTPPGNGPGEVAATMLRKRSGWKRWLAGHPPNWRPWQDSNLRHAV